MTIENKQSLESLPTETHSQVSDRRETFLVGMLASTDDDTNNRIVTAYRAGRTVEAAESELRKIIDEILHEN